MEKFSQKENNVLNFNLSYLFNTNKNRDFIPYNNNINERSQNNKKNLNNKEYTQKNENRPFIFNTNPFFLNMLRYNYNPLINQKGNNGINSLLLDFNNELREEYENEEKNINNKNDINNNNNKNNSYDFTPLIKKLESQKDERFVKSRFLKFIKDINSNKIIINEEKNIIEENKDIIKEIHNEKSIEDLETNELEELLNKAKKYIDYSREDLAINILETIFDNSLIKLEKNKKYLEKAYIYIIICNLNMNEYLIAISFIIDLLNLIEEENEKNYNNKYLEKEFIEKINRRDFDIGDKTQYENYENDKNKIKKEIENLIKKIISTNNKENYNEMLFLLYGLILYLNENYIEAEQAFSQLIILNDQNYFYFNILGVINANQKKDEEAIKYYKKALELNKEYPKCLINYGVILSNQGKIKECCGYIISALKIFDDIPEAWNLLLSNVIDLDEEEIICEINNRNLINIEKSLLINK
jgi:tetratricopeptide (TPR) repeat protein